MSNHEEKLKDYVDVASRIAEFREKHPKGSLRPVNPSKPYDILTIGNATFIVYAAAAYRDEEDYQPGIGIAYEPFPGLTPFTRNSELQNAETAAWGRAIIATLAADARKGIATQEDIRNRTEEKMAVPYDDGTIRAETSQRPDVIYRAKQKHMFALFNKVGITDKDEQRARAIATINRDIDSASELTLKEMDLIIEYLELGRGAE